MKVLFLARHASYLRNFESAVAGLAEGGHDIVLSVERDEAMGGWEMLERLAARYPKRITLGRTPRRPQDGWQDSARNLRLGLDYLRYLDPLYRRAPYLRARAADRAPEVIVGAMDRPLARLRPARVGLAALLRWLERGVPRSPAIDEFLRAQAPDVVLLTPLIDLGSPQIDYLESAKALGLRTALCVTSWDHLSTKALIRTVPDLITVWNKTQKREAVKYHGVPPDRVAVTGAHAYDHWFTWQPTRTREEFCARVGLPADRPFLLYVASSLFRGTADETVFAEKWIREVRESPYPELRRAGILIRPHPGRMDDWKRINTGRIPYVSLWGEHPIHDEAKADYYDSMYYSAAVVGLNTSAFLEAAILGKSIFTVLLPKYSRDNQEGTLHFQYLVDERTGVLHVAHSFEEHTAQLDEALRARVEPDPWSRRFVEHFIRPFGLDVPATPRFVKAIEALARRPAPAPAGDTIGRRLARRAWPAAARVLRLGERPKRGSRLRSMTPYEAAQRAKREALKGLPLAPPRASALTPKIGKARTEKVLAGVDVREAVETRQAIQQIAASGKPIVVGPWLSEAGFELLYWIPFLRWAQTFGGLSPERLVVISRGGTAPWYHALSAQYDDVLQYFTPDEFRVRNEARIVELRGTLKHMESTSFDKDIIHRVATARGLDDFEVLHPSLMYRLFQEFWRQHVPITLIEAFTEYEPIPAAAGEDAIRAQLPANYVAVKFYGNTALPDTEENRRFAAGLLAELGRDTDLVLLNTGVRFDDHEDFPSELRDRFHTLDALMTPANNLAVQTAAIRGSEAFIGTYGGFSYLAPLCGVDTVAFYSHAGGFRWDHLEIAKRVFASLGAGAFTEVDVMRTGALQRAFGTGRAAIEAAVRT